MKLEDHERRLWSDFLSTLRALERRQKLDGRAEGGDEHGDDALHAPAAQVAVEDAGGADEPEAAEPQDVAATPDVAQAPDGVEMTLSESPVEDAPAWNEANPVEDGPGLTSARETEVVDAPAWNEANPVLDEGEGPTSSRWEPWRPEGSRDGDGEPGPAMPPSLSLRRDDDSLCG